MYRLTICVPTVVGREDVCSKLIDEVKRQIKENSLEKEVELILDKDNKEISIGAKRQRMYLASKGLFTVQLDDDDWIATDYVKLCYEGTFEPVDCIGYHEHCTFDGIRPKVSDFSIKYPAWKEYQHPLNGRFNHVRTPFCKSPIKTEICKKVGVKDMRFGEDHDFAIRVYPFLKKEHYINKSMYFYRYKTENHKVKYGIK
jgi:glycosyltransferase involved in cell wall biosynthesis